MPTTTNETGFTATNSPSGSDSNRSAGNGGAPTDATGAEVPVVVHASRYSATTKGGAKPLPPVNEETRTVIVFAQGAVVRLTANVSVGETVVLTNKQTGADVICRVSSVKTQPGIQNYVNLEFTQRAPGFWGEATQAGRGDSETTPTISAPAPQMPSLETPPPAAVRQASPRVAPEVSAPFPSLATPAQATPPPPPPAVPQVSPLRAALDTERLTPVASDPMPVTAIPAVPVQAPRASTGAGSTLGLGSSSPAQSSTSTSAATQPLAFPTREESSGSGAGSKKLMVAAAVALVALGGIAGALISRKGQPAAAPTQVATASSSAAAPAFSVPETQPATAGAPSALAPVTPAPSNVEIREDAPPVEAAVSRSSVESTRAAASSSASAAAPTRGDIRATQPGRLKPEIGKISTPIAKKASNLVSSEPPPMLSGAPSLPGNDALLASTARNNGPVAPAPAKGVGGQVQQPKPVSAPPAVYPSEARNMRIQGDVVIDALVSELGRVVATKVISGPPQLQEAAIAAVRTWTYQPARLDGQPTSIHILVTVNFRLK